MALKVIGAGFGRTGTSSLKVALEHLGYDPCHHMKEVLTSSEQIKWFEQISRGEPIDWNIVFSKFEAAVDWPSSAYYEELALYYPDAKVILSIRNAEKWHQSTLETIFSMSEKFPKWLLWIFPPACQWLDMVYRIIWDGIFDGRFEDHDHAVNVFLKHIEKVKSVIPAERLLVHEAKDGWEPLCHFLGKQIPDIAYPRFNERKKLKRVIYLFICLEKLPWILIGILTTLALYSLV